VFCAKNFVQAADRSSLIAALAWTRGVLIALLLGIVVSPAFAQSMFYDGPRAPANNTKVPILEKVGIDQKLNQTIPLNLTFHDENGSTVPLSSYFGQRPVILTLVYYQCPMLCTQVLNGLVSGLLPVKLDVGKDFDIVTVSIDPAETPAMARAKKDVYVRRYGRQTTAEGWHFLTGEQANIAALASAVGYRYAYDANIKQYAHPSAVMVLTPEGRIAQYFYGIEYTPKDLRLGLVESSKGQIGTVVDQALLYCYHYDPTTGKYGAAVMNILRLAGIATVMGMGVFIVKSLRRDASHSGGLRGRAA
jgi:protein SCO1